MSRGRCVSLPRGPQAPADARHAITDWVDGIVDGRYVEDLKLLVSELVTNAVRHPQRQGHIDLSLELGRGRVRVEVADPGEGFRRPRVGEPPPDSPGGRGLLIVDRIASRWGVTPGPPTRVWFELSF